MSHHLKDRILAQYPGWHTHPIRLATPEMQHPHVVLKDFFSAYHLTDIRVCLRGGLAALSAGMKRLQWIIYTCMIVSNASLKQPGYCTVTRKESNKKRKRNNAVIKPCNW